MAKAAGKEFKQIPGEMLFNKATAAASQTEPSSKRKRDTRPAEHIKTLHEAWLKACAPGEDRKLYEFVANISPRLVPRSEYILAVSERQAIDKWREVTDSHPVTRVMKSELAKRMAQAMSLFAERELGSEYGNTSDDDKGRVDTVDPEPPAREPVQGGGKSSPNGDVPF